MKIHMPEIIIIESKDNISYLNTNTENYINLSILFSPSLELMINHIVMILNY